MNNSRQESTNEQPAIVLEAIGLCRRFDNAELLYNVSISIRGGDRIALTGPTGSGKSLLLRSLALLDSTDSGRLRWQGEKVFGNQIPKYRSQVIYLHQQAALAEGTVEENLKLPFEFRIHSDRKFDRDQVVRSLKSLGRPATFLDKKHSDLSGGEVQLTVLLRAIQLDPHILLLDEPTAALDAQSTKQFESFVDDWLDKSPNQRAVLWVTHDEAQVPRISTTQLKINNGVVVGPEE